MSMSMNLKGMLVCLGVLVAEARAVAGAPWPDLKPGTWIAYRIEAPGARVAHLRMTALGTPFRAQGERMWVKLELGLEPDLREPLSQLRVLLNRRTGAVEAADARVLGGDARPLAHEALEGLSLSFRNLPATSAGATGMLRILKSPAGVLRTRFYEARGTGGVVLRAWTCEALPFWQLARLEIPAAAQRMEVEGYGKDGDADVGPKAGAPK